MNALLSGHHHRASSGAILIGADGGHSILIVHAGTAISTRTRRAEANSYNLIKIGPDLVSVIIIAAGGTSGFRESEVTSYQRDATASLQ